VSQAHGRNSNELATFTPTPYQEEFLRGDKRYLGFVSGVGAGKTYAGIIRTFLNMERWNPGEMGAIIAPTRQMVINVIIPEMREIGLLDKWTHNSSHSDEPGLHSPNGSRALILSADNQKTIERLRGLNLSWVWIDERTAVPERAQEIAMQRLRTGNYRNLYVTTTPKGKDSVYEFFAKGVDATPYGEAQLYEQNDRLAIVGVPTSANPHTPEDYKQAMDSDLPDEIRAQEIQGQFVEIGAGLLTYDMLEEVPASVLEGQAWKWHVAVDLGVETNPRKAQSNDTDYWALALVAENKDPQQHTAYLCGVWRKRGQAPSAAANWIREIIDRFGIRHVKYEKVQAQAWFESHLKEKGLTPIPHNPRGKKEDRIIGLSVPFSNHNVKLIDWSGVPGVEMDWSDFKSEWASFPEGSHDDQLDSVAMALEDVNFGGRFSGLSGDMYGRANE